MRKIIFSIIFHFLFVNLAFGERSLLQQTPEKKMHVLLNVSGDSPYSNSAQGGSLATFNAAVLGQLLKYDKHFIIEPGLLEDAFYDFETTEYVLILRENTYFHNGREANSKDLEFSLLRGFFTNHPTYYNMFFGNIIGVDKIEKLGLKKFESGVVSGLKIIDKYTVRIKLSVHNPDFLYYLVEPYFSLVPIEELEDNYMVWKKYPVGAGSYSVVEPGFQDGIVKIKKNNLSLTKSPDLIYFYTKDKKDIHYDISLVDQINYKQKGYNTFYSEHPRYVNSIYFTNNNPLGISYEFKKFIQAALDRKPMQKLIAASDVTYELLPKSYWGRNSIPDPYNPKLAQELFDSLPKKLRDKKWNVPVFAGKEKDILADEIKNQLAKYGFKISFFPSTEKFISKKTAENTPFEISGCITFQLDPLIMFAQFTNKSPDLYEKPPFDKNLENLYENALMALTKEDKVERVQALSQYVNEKAYIIPLLERKSIIFYNPNTIESLGKQDQALIFFASRVEMKKLK